jgi:hypothetical protein
MLPDSLVHLFIMGHAGGDKNLIADRPFFSQLQCLTAFAASASADNKYGLPHLLLQISNG